MGSNKKYRKQLKLIGVAQGWDTESYYENTKKMLDIGFDYITIGGVARSSNSEIISILGAVSEIISDYSEKNNKHIDLHVLGVGRASLFRTYFESNVTSFDTATYLRQAWLSEKSNYQLGFEDYVAIRVRKENEDIKVLNSLRDYNNKKITLDEIKIILHKNRNITAADKCWDQYSKTLTEQPWMKCKCKICKNIGFDVVIFCGNNRNRRRGFHNIWNFYFHKFLKFSPKISIVYHVDRFIKNKALEHIPLKIRKQFVNFPIEIFVTNGEITFHQSEVVINTGNSKYIKQQEMSKIILTNKMHSKTDILLKQKPSEIFEQLIDIYNKTIEELNKPKNRFLLEGEDIHQSKIDTYFVD